MLRSLFSGITGLRQHQTMMDVVGNNIANVNTTGFKASSVVFEDTLSQMVRAAGAPSNGVGGINPSQVGLGVQLGGIGTNFGQGSVQTTGKSTDLMIQGDGFFVVRNGGESIYTRAGAFTFDSDGRLVNNQGMVVQGWAVDDTGAVNTDGPLSDIMLPAGSMIAPAATTTVTVGGNITSSTPDAMTLGATVFDAAGNGTPITVVFTPNGTPGMYDVAVNDANGASLGTGDITFSTADGTRSASTNPTFTVNDTAITMNLDAITNYGGPKSLNVTATDGAAAGSLQQFRISPDGSVIGIFSNGLKQPMAKIALANFNNPGGLEKIGSTCYRTTTNSGLPQVGEPMSGGRGQLLGGGLEMSNVDLAQEFTSLIVAQRGFQANSRVITSSDEMLQELVNLKR
jgi:flagellar hook protein FlgE